MDNSPKTFMSSDLKNVRFTQQQAIDGIMEEVLKNKDPSVKFHCSDVFDGAHGHRWVMFGKTAYMIISRFVEKPGYRYEYIPLLIEGKMLKKSYDKGTGAVAYLKRTTHRNGVEVPESWSVAFMNIGFIHKDDLKMCKDHVLNNIKIPGIRS